MKTMRFLSILIVWLMLTLRASAASNESQDHGDSVELGNGELLLSIGKAGGEVKLQDKAGNLLMDSARASCFFKALKDESKVISLPPLDERQVASRSFSIKPFSDNHGKGRQIIMSETDAEGVTVSYHYGLYEQGGRLTLGFTVRNASKQDVRVFAAVPLLHARVKAFAGAKNLVHLIGGAGNTENNVESGADFCDLNNALVTGVTGAEQGRRISLVMGGSRYRDFLRIVRSRMDKNGLIIDILANDPSGRLVSAGKTYESQDASTIDMSTSDPFQALEDYGRYLASLNQIRLNYYDFPTLCGWAMGSVAYNRSDYLVEEAQAIKATGFTRFTPVALRLEPDTYAWKDNGNTEQGWWDDEHMLKYNHLSAPYDTFEKFCSGLKQAGCIPFTYHQVNVPSRDFVRAHPDFAMGNDITKIEAKYWRYNIFLDYTDPACQRYYLDVWKRWRKDGLQGIKFDYPNSGWMKDGGFEDKEATTSSAYRQSYLLCREGLGPNAYIHERALNSLGFNDEFHYRASDLTIGIVDLQRTHGDTKSLSASMMGLIGNRWYKSRTVMGYYPDSKGLSLPGAYLPQAKKSKVRFIDKERYIPLRPAVRRNILNQIYFISGRLELATPISLLDDATRSDLTKVFPVLQSPRSPRPIDLFSGKKIPQIYAYEVEPGWQQVMAVNTFNRKVKEEELKNVPLNEQYYIIHDDPTGIQSVKVSLGVKKVEEGGLGLDETKRYHVYDFWANRHLGIVKGNDSIKIDLKPFESAVLSIREVRPHPQVISTDRHIMQGMFELKDVKWTAATLSGKLAIVSDSPITVVVARNGFKGIPSVKAEGAKVTLETEGDELLRLRFVSSESRTLDWQLSFSTPTTSVP